MFCYLTLPVLLLAACVVQPSVANAQMTSLGVDCSKIDVPSLMMQDSMRAGLILIQCGIVQGGQPSAGGATKLPAPPNIRASNRACSSSSSCTKSESMVWASTKNGGQTIVVNYNDSKGDGSDYSGTSYSSDGGVTFHEIQPPPFGSSSHGSNFGDPLVVFNSKMGKFFAGDIVGGGDCGGDGLGLWSSADGIHWTTSSCPHVGSGDDRPSMWVDNEPTSKHYGRMYVSWNDFANNAALSVVYSDNGMSWTGPVILNSGSTFIRNVQLTGAPRGAKLVGTSSAVFVAGMDEGGGSNNTRENIMYRSTNGGASWTAVIMGPRFNPPGDAGCSTNSYFYQVNPIWRHMGWGQPGVGPGGIVHYVYAGAGTNGDHGDIFYQRSTDNGNTWSKPRKINTDPDAPFKTQWMPSLSVDPNGEVTVSWYDRRSATSACNNVTDPGCRYERVGRQTAGPNGGFLPEFAISTGLIPQPAQDDPTVQQCYAGDYDYHTAIKDTAYLTWTDGRRSVGGVHVQDVDFAKVPEP
jgi:hypothetical protein